MTSESLPPAQWYPDPHQAGFLRYWDGTAWTEHLAPVQQPAALSQGGPNPATPKPKREKRARPDKKIAKVGDDEFLAEIDKRVNEILDTIEEGDVATEAGLVFRLQAYAKGRKGKAGLALAEQRLVEGKRATGAQGPKLIGEVSAERFRDHFSRTGKMLTFQPGETIRVFEDRVLQGGSAHKIDAYTQAQVYLDGQTQITTRPSLTMLAALSPLPGSSLGPALAMAKKETSDLRVAEFQVAGPDWSFSVAVSPDGLSGPRALAQKINNTAAKIQAESQDPVAMPTNAPTDVVAQIERVVKLQESGAISPEQAEALKARLIAG